MASPPDALLFTPGPLTVSASVKSAMLSDLGSRDARFLRVVREIREELLSAAGVSTEAGYECIIMQGSGTFGIEAVLSTSLPRAGAKLLVCENGAYGRRMRVMAERLGVETVLLSCSENVAVSPTALAAALAADAGITHVAVVHHETTAGVLNDVPALGAVCRSAERGVVFIVDSMSGFGAYPLHVAEVGVDFLVSSSNKCFEGVPGFSFTIARRAALLACAGQARSLSLDLLEQWQGLSASGQFRFTPPTHVLLAFRQALREHAAEGGAPARLARYAANFEALRAGMARLGFQLWVSEGPHRGCIISTFLWPEDGAFNFERFYEGLAARGFVIYPGKLTAVAQCFRIGNIGQLYVRHVEALLGAIEEVLKEQGVALPVKQIAGPQ